MQGLDVYVQQRRRNLLREAEGAWLTKLALAENVGH